jgi:chitinase
MTRSFTQWLPKCLSRLLLLTLAAPAIATAQNSALTGLRAVYLQTAAGLQALERLPVGQVDLLLLAFMRICGPQQLPADTLLCAGRAAPSLAVGAEQRAFNRALRQRKQQEPALRALASVGGWGGSDGFYAMAASPASRAVFVDSVVRYLQEHNALDGIDIDWEHPGDNGSANGVALGSADDGVHFVALLRELRAALDLLGQQQQRRLLLGAAINVTQPVLRRLDLPTLAEPLDWMFMMSYDYHGGWNRHVGHHAALRPGQPPADDSLVESVQALRQAGVPPHKLMVGAAFYGRAWQGVARPVPGAAAQGVALTPDGALGWAVLSRCCLSSSGEGRAGFVRVRDSSRRADALWHPAKRIYISYESAWALREKARWAREQGLAGIFAWEWGHDDGRLLQALQPN